MYINLYYIYIYLEPKRPLFLVEKGYVLRGPSKIDVILGSRYIVVIYTTHIFTEKIYSALSLLYLILFILLLSLLFLVSIILIFTTHDTVDGRILPTTQHVGNPVNNEIFTISTGDRRISEPSTHSGLYIIHGTHVSFETKTSTFLEPQDFVNHRLQLVMGITSAVIWGAQIVIPDHQWGAAWWNWAIPWVSNIKFCL